MKTGLKAVLVSMIILALALSSVAGATYSWFVDSEEFDVVIDPLDVDVDYVVSTAGAGNDIILEKGANDFELTVTNNNGFPVSFEAEFFIPRYFDNPYGNDYRLENGVYSVDEALTGAHNNGFREKSVGAITVSFGNGPSENLTQSMNESLGNIGQGGAKLLETRYGSTYSCSILPGSVITIDVTVNVGSEYTSGSVLSPRLILNSIQPDVSGTPKSITMVNGAGSFDMGDLDGATWLSFGDENGNSIELGWQVLSTPGLETVDVSISDSAGGRSISVIGKDSSGSTLDFRGQISYKIVVEKAVLSLHGGADQTDVNTETPCILDLVQGSEGVSGTVSFTDSASTRYHELKTMV